MVDLYFFPHETLAVESEAKQCRSCGTMAFIFSNRFGNTSCVGCADLLERELKALGAAGVA